VERKIRSGLIVLVIQKENDYWIAYVEGHPKIRWVGFDAQDTVDTYLKQMHPGEEFVNIKIKEKK